jgi:hypothetical protein
MKNIYESFEEIADDMCDGEYIGHALSEHSSKLCYVWQNSIREFARALDGAGIELPKDERIYEDFWSNIGKVHIEWKAGFNRRKPYSKKLGELSLDEAFQRYDFKGEVGYKLFVPSYDLNGEIANDYYLIVE